MTEEQKPEGTISEEAKPEAPSSTAGTPIPDAKAPQESSLASRALRWIFRMFVTVLLGIALGAAIFYGARNFYQDAIEPLQTIDQRMRELESGFSDLAETVREDRAANIEDMAELQSKLSAQTEEIASLTAQIDRLEAQTADQAEALNKLDDLRADLDQVQRDLESSDEQLQALADIIEAGELPAERVGELLHLMRTMSLMTRARLWIEQDNFGLAAEDIQAALQIMGPLAVEADPDTEIGMWFQEISDRLTVAVEIVRSNPGLAEEELEIVWKLLIQASAP